jgi:hypothetical protein
MHNFCGMARMLLNGESRSLTVCTVNGLGVAEKSLLTTLTREARYRPSKSATEKAATASSFGCVEILLVTNHCCSTAWVYSFEVPPTDSKKVVGTPTPATNSMPRQRLRSTPFRRPDIRQIRLPKPAASRFQINDLGILHRQRSTLICATHSQTVRLTYRT